MEATGLTNLSLGLEKINYDLPLDKLGSKQGRMSRGQIVVCVISRKPNLITTTLTSDKAAELLSILNGKTEHTQPFFLPSVRTPVILSS